MLKTSFLRGVSSSINSAYLPRNSTELEPLLSNVERPTHGIPSNNWFLNSNASAYSCITIFNPIKLIDSFFNYFKDKTIGQKTFFFINLFYSCWISFLFSLFSARRAPCNIELSILYALSSFVMNAPMAWRFLDKSKNAVLLFGQSWSNRKKSGSLYLFAFAISVLLVAFTLPFAWQLATETARSDKFVNSQVLLHWITHFSSLLNTITTRFIGTINKIDGGLNFLIHLYYKNQHQYAPIYAARDDVARYGARWHIDSRISHEIAADSISDANLAFYLAQFYQKMRKENQRPGTSWSYFAKTVFKSMITFALLTVSLFNMVPLWLHLTEEGVRSMNNSMLRSPFFVFMSMLTNQLFYLDFGETVDSIEAFCIHFYTNIKKKYEQFTSFKATWTVGAFTLVTVGVLISLAYLSGGGYAKDADDVLHFCLDSTTIKLAQCQRNLLDSFSDCNWPDGFGKTAQLLWFSWMGWWTSLFKDYYSILAGFSAGVVVNGRSFFGWSIDNISYCKKPDSEGKEQQQKVLQALDKIIKEKRFIHDSSLSSVLNDINNSREAANPYRWFSQQSNSNVSSAANFFVSSTP